MDKVVLLAERELLMKRVAELEAQVEKARKGLERYAFCCDGCTCGDGWDHDAAQEALAALKEGKDQ